MMPSATTSSDLPLLCQLGWHRVAPMATWNHGYYFSTCKRCHRELVRTAFGSWHIPQGFRVVWQSQPPQAMVSPDLVKDAPLAEKAGSDEAVTVTPAKAVEAGTIETPPAGEPAAPDRPREVPPFMDFADTEPPPASAAAPAVAATAWDEEGHSFDDRPAPPSHAPADTLPIQEVLRSLDQGSPPEDEAARVQPQPEPVTPDRPRYRAIPDFMSEEQEARWVPHDFHANRAKTLDEVQSRRSGWSFSWPRWTQPHKTQQDEASAEDSSNLQVGTPGVPALAFIGGLLIIAAILGLRGCSSSIYYAPAQAPAPVAAPPQAVAAAPKPVAETTPAVATPTTPPQEADLPEAYVAASIVNCRSAPTQASRPVRKIVRGEGLQVVAIHDDWVSVAYRGGQCWVLRPLLSAVKPFG